jgi:hypothetical protein
MPIGLLVLGLRRIKSLVIDAKVAATGIIALCLVLSAVLFISSGVNPSLEGVGDGFFTLAVVLIAVVVLLSAIGVKVRFP